MTETDGLRGTGTSKNVVATFSVVAFDPDTDPLGVCVQSKSLAVGSVAPGCAIDGDVRKKVVDALLHSEYIEEDADDDAVLDALSAFIRTENVEERKQRRGYLDRAVLRYMEGRG